MNGAVDFPLDQPDLAFTASGSSRVTRSVLPSGVRILTEHVPGLRSATVGFWVAVGSRDETGALALAPAALSAATPSTGASSFGSTHFLEHLLFKGTPSRSALDIAIAFDAVGGESNAVTAKEYTCYYAKVQDRDLAMAVDTIADMVTSSSLDPDEFETERGVILEELAMAEDDPSDVVNERFFESVFGDHPLGRPIGGDAVTIGTATRDAVLDHYRAHYRPRDLVVTAAGAVDHDEVVRRVTTALTAAGWDLDTPARPVDRRATGPAAITGGPPLVVIPRPTEQVNLIAGVPGLIATDERRMTLAVMNSILGGGMSSRLFQEIRERRGLAYAVYSYTPSYSDGGLVGLYAGCSPSKSVEVAEVLLAELRGMASGSVTLDEVERAHGQLSGGSALALEDSDARMTRLGRSEITLGEFADLDETLRRIQRVTAADITELAGELAGGRASLAVVGPVDEERFRSVIG